jgi:hypothetical protein
MKFLFPLAAVCILAGCASTAPRPANYGTRTVAEPAVAYTPAPAVGTVTEDGWRVVSVTPVGQEPYNSYQVVPQPVPPAYYYAPPISFGLGIMLGRGLYFSGHHHPRWRHHGRRR